MARKIKLITFCLWYVVHVLCLVDRNSAQTPANAPTTDPAEVAAINSVFGEWGITALPTWNMSGNPCTGVAIDEAKSFDDQDMNPAIKCQCPVISGNGSATTTCHITALKVFAMSVVGTIPDALASLTHLTNLDLRQNHLTGPLPAFVGNMTGMQYLSFGTNALSGSIPKELGNLRNLKSLSFTSNQFTGPLPPELGDLVNLQQMYFSSSGVSGPIPSTFAKLVNLETLWASDNELNSTIPDFIGNWTKLKALRFQGNNFDGPIPEALSNLTSLTDLRIGEIKNGTSSLAFIRNLKNLTILILRNNRISGSIPSNIGEYQSLQSIDLSFNNLTGEIASSLFNLSSLAYLFLGNNNFSGGLPASKSSSLTTIDLSYNQLSGSLPSWTKESLQLNLVANNFVISSTNDDSALPLGLNCLQRNFPCNRALPRYSRFAVNCGGGEMTSVEGIFFDRDDESLGPATYYVDTETRWAVSSVGRFNENPNPSYIRNSSSPLSNTLDSGLFQKARLSPSSLRYFGLGLQNGQYTVTMQFAEIIIEDSTTYRSLGRRFFDVYAQGNLQLKNFNIKNAAGGSSNRAVVRTFKVNVTENFLEIHLFWAGKGTCCIPVHGTYGPSISAISATPDFVPTVSDQPPSTGSKKKKTGLIVGIVVGVVALSFIFFALLIRRQRRRDIDDDEDFQSIAGKPDTFSYSELKNATEDFSPANKLGEGGFGAVYKGTLSDGSLVAVKQLLVPSRQAKSQFVTEISMISAVQHKNLVKLNGYCIEGNKRLLVYEYLEKKSLDQALFGKGKLNLDWPTRYGICLGTARGLAYLHEQSRLRIVHRDIKASNILLDAELVPKISDFGLAKLYDDKKTHISTRVAGTIGYLAPEYAMRGHLTEKADVFSFGVVTLEIVSGRSNQESSLDQEKRYLLEWAWNLHENSRALELMDSTLPEYNEGEALCLIGVALLCTQATPSLRPPMSHVVAMLSGNIEVGCVNSRPGYLTDLQFEEEGDSFMTIIDNSREMTGTTTTTTTDTTTTSPQGGCTSSSTPHWDRLPKASQPMLLNEL